MAAVIGTKIGMTRVFDDGGQSVPVTVVRATPVTVVRVFDEETHGYNAIQIGSGNRKEKRISKAVRGQMSPAGRSDFEILAELLVDDPSAYEVGQSISAADVFSAGDLVDVTGRSKGRGFPAWCAGTSLPARRPPTVPTNPFVVRAASVLALTRAGFSRARRCRARWER